MNSHPNSSSVKPAEGNSVPGMAFEPFKVKTEVQQPIQTIPEKREYTRYRKTAQMEDFNGDLKLPGRIRAESYSCEARRPAIISAHFASNNTVCVWNDQTGQSVVVASNQSTRDALATLCQRDSAVEKREAVQRITYKKVEDRTNQEKDLLKVYSEEYLSKQFTSRYRSQSVCLPRRPPKKSQAYIDPSNLTAEEAQAMFYTYLNYTQQASTKKSQKLKAENKLQPFLKQIKKSTPSKSTSSLSLNIKPKTPPETSIAVQPPISCAGRSHAEPVKKDNRSHFGMSRFLEKTPSLEGIASPIPSSEKEQKEDTSGPSATPNESLSPPDQGRNEMEEGANPSSEVVKMDKVSPTPVSLVVNDTSVPNDSNTSQGVVSLNPDRPIKIEPDLEVTERVMSQTVVRQNSVVNCINTPVSRTPRSKSTPASEFTHEDLIAFLKEPLAMARAAELAALKEKACESKPKRKPRARTAAARRPIRSDSKVVETIKQRTTVVSQSKSIKCSRSQSIPSNVSIFSCAGKNSNKIPIRHMENPLLRNLPGEYIPGGGPSIRSFIRLDMPLGQALQEVPLGAVAGQLRVQKALYEKMDGLSSIVIESASTVGQNLVGEPAPPLPEKKPAPKRKKPTKAEIEAEGGDPNTEKPKKKKAPPKKKPKEDELQQIEISAFHQEQVVFQQPVQQSTHQALPSVANLLPPLNNYHQKTAPQQQSNYGVMENNMMNGYRYSDGTAGSSSSSSSVYSSFDYAMNTVPEPPRRHQSIASMLKPLAGTSEFIQQGEGQQPSTSNNVYSDNNQQYQQHPNQFNMDAYQPADVYTRRSSSTDFFGTFESNQFQSSEFPPHSVESHISCHSRDSNTQNSHQSSMPQTPISQQANNGSLYNAMPVNNDTQSSQSNNHIVQPSSNFEFDAEEFANQYGVIDTRTTVSPIIEGLYAPGLSEIQVEDFFEAIERDQTPENSDTTASSSYAANKHSVRSEISTPSDFLGNFLESGPPSNAVHKEQQAEHEQRNCHSVPNNTEFHNVRDPAPISFNPQRVMKSASTGGQSSQSCASVQYISREPTLNQSSQEKQSQNQIHFQEPNAPQNGHNMENGHFNNFSQPVNQQSASAPQSASVTPAPPRVVDSVEQQPKVSRPGDNLLPPDDKQIVYVQYLPNGSDPHDNDQPPIDSELSTGKFEGQLHTAPPPVPARRGHSKLKNKNKKTIDPPPPPPPVPQEIHSELPIGEVLKNNPTMFVSKETSAEAVMLSPTNVRKYIKRGAHEPMESFSNPPPDSVVISIDSVIANAMRTPSSEISAAEKKKIDKNMKRDSEERILAGLKKTNPESAITSHQKINNSQMRSPKMKSPPSQLQQMLMKSPVNHQQRPRNVQHQHSHHQNGPMQQPAMHQLHNGQHAMPENHQLQQNAKVEYVAQLPPTSAPFQPPTVPRQVGSNIAYMETSGKATKKPRARHSRKTLEVVYGPGSGHNPNEPGARNQTVEMHLQQQMQNQQAQFHPTQNGQQMQQHQAQNQIPNNQMRQNQVQHQRIQYQQQNMVDQRAPQNQQQINAQQMQNQQIQNQPMQNQQIQKPPMQNQQIQNQPMQNQHMQSQQMQGQHVQLQHRQGQPIQSQQMHNQQQLGGQQVQNQQTQNQQMHNQPMQNQHQLHGQQTQSQPNQNQQMQCQQSQMQNQQQRHGHNMQNQPMQGQPMQNQQMQDQQVQGHQGRIQHHPHSHQMQHQQMQSQPMQNQQLQNQQMQNQPMKNQPLTNQNLRNQLMQNQPAQNQHLTQNHMVPNRQMQNPQMQNQSMQNGVLNEQMQGHQMQNQQPMYNQQMQQQLKNQLVQKGQFQQVPQQQMASQHVQNQQVVHQQLPNHQVQNQQMRVNSMANQHRQHQQMTNQQLQHQNMQEQQHMRTQQPMTQQNQQSQIRVVETQHGSAEQVQNQHGQIHIVQYQRQSANQLEPLSQQLLNQAVQKARKPRIRKSRAKPKPPVQIVLDQHVQLQQAQNMERQMPVGQQQRPPINGMPSQTSNVRPNSETGPVQRSASNYPLLQAQLMKPSVPSVSQRPEQQVQQQQHMKQSQQLPMHDQKLAFQYHHAQTQVMLLSQEVKKAMSTCQMTSPKEGSTSQAQAPQLAPVAKSTPVATAFSNLKDGEPDILKIIKDQLANESMQPAVVKPPKPPKVKAPRPPKPVKEPLADPAAIASILPLIQQINPVARAKRMRELIKDVADLPSFTPEEFFSYRTHESNGYSLDDFMEFHMKITKEMEENPCAAEIGVADVLADPELEPALHGRFRKRLIAIREGRTLDTTFKKRRQNNPDGVAAKKMRPQEEVDLTSEPHSAEHSLSGQPAPIGSHSEPLSISTDLHSYHSSSPNTELISSSHFLSSPDRLADSSETLYSMSHRSPSRKSHSSTNLNSVSHQFGLSSPSFSPVLMSDDNANSSNDNKYGHNERSLFDVTDDFPNHVIEINSNNNEERSCTPSVGILDDINTVDASFLLNASPYPSLELHGDLHNCVREMSPDFVDPRHLSQLPSSFDSVVFNEATQDFDPVSGSNSPTNHFAHEFDIDNDHDTSIDHFVKEYKSANGHRSAEDLFKNDFNKRNNQSASNGLFMNDFDITDGQCSSKTLAAQKSQQGTSTNFLEEDFDLLDSQETSLDVLSKANTSSVFDEQKGDTKLSSKPLRTNYKTIAKFHVAEIGSRFEKDERKHGFLNSSTTLSNAVSPTHLRDKHGFLLERNHRQQADYSRQLREVESQVSSDKDVVKVLEKLRDEPSFFLKDRYEQRFAKPVFVEPELPNNKRGANKWRKSAGFEELTRPQNSH